MKKTTRIIVAPARYKFDVIQNLTPEAAAALGEAGIMEWSWFSARELHAAALSRLILKWGDKPVTFGASIEQLFRLKGFTDLNRPADQFTWFIDVGDGHLFVNRSPKACPFEDDELYVPALWGKRVMTVAKQGFVLARQEVEGQKIFWEGVYPDGTKKRFGEGLFSE